MCVCVCIILIVHRQMVQLGRSKSTQIRDSFHPRRLSYIRSVYNITIKWIIKHLIGQSLEIYPLENTQRTHLNIKINNPNVMHSPHARTHTRTHRITSYESRTEVPAPASRARVCVCV